MEALTFQPIHWHEIEDRGKLRVKKIRLVKEKIAMNRWEFTCPVCKQAFSVDVG